MVIPECVTVFVRSTTCVLSWCSVISWVSVNSLLAAVGYSCGYWRATCLSGSGYFMLCDVSSVLLTCLFLHCIWSGLLCKATNHCWSSGLHYFVTSSYCTFSLVLLGEAAVLYIASLCHSCRQCHLDLSCRCWRCFLISVASYLGLRSLHVRRWYNCSCSAFHYHLDWEQRSVGQTNSFNWSVSWVERWSILSCLASLRSLFAVCSVRSARSFDCGYRSMTGIAMT